MATQQLQHDLLQNEQFDEVRAFLSEHGIPPDDERAILQAIRARGWDLAIGGEPGDWTVEIREWQGPTESQTSTVEDSDRTRALLRALRLALSWLTPEQERQAFDRQARELMGMSGEEFMARWRAGGLAADDPRVLHLLLLRPLGS